MRPRDVRRRGPVIAEHMFNLGAIRIGQREVCSERDTAIKIIMRSMQIAELATRVAALIENLSVVWIERDQPVEIGERPRPIAHLQTRPGAKPICRRKSRVDLDRVTELLPGRAKIPFAPEEKARVGGRTRGASRFVGSPSHRRLFGRCR